MLGTVIYNTKILKQTLYAVWPPCYNRTNPSFKGNTQSSGELLEAKCVTCMDTGNIFCMEDIIKLNLSRSVVPNFKQTCVFYL